MPVLQVPQSGNLLVSTAHFVNHTCADALLHVLCRCARPVIIASLVIFFLGTLIVMPFQIVSVMLQVFTLGTFSAGSIKSGMRSWVMETTSLVPLFALSLLRSGKHHSSPSCAPLYVHHLARDSVV